LINYSNLKFIYADTSADVDACEYVVKNVKTKIKPLVKQEGEFFYCDECGFQTGSIGNTNMKVSGMPVDRCSLRKHQRTIHVISVIIKQQEKKASKITTTKNSASADGVLAPGFVHARPSTRPPLDTSRNFSAHVSAESPSNISLNPSEVISEVWEP
jgi:hypothetical protein